MRAACSGTVAAGNRILCLRCSGGGHVLRTLYKLDHIQRTLVGNPFRCPIEACGARLNRDTVFIFIARANPDVRGSSLDLEGHPMSDVSTTSPVRVFPVTVAVLVLNHRWTSLA